MKLHEAHGTLNDLPDDAVAQIRLTKNETISEHQSKADKCATFIPAKNVLELFFAYTQGFQNYRKYFSWQLDSNADARITKWKEIARLVLYFIDHK